MDNEYVQVSKFVLADLTILETKLGYNNKEEYYKTSFLFSENLYTIVQCDEHGEAPRYRSIGYGACRLDGDVILFIDEKHGWLPHKEATKEWANKIVERELLDVTKSDGKK